MKKNRFAGDMKAFFFILGLLSLTILSCKESEDDLVKPKTVTDVLRENPQFSIFREIVQFAGMNDALRADNITIFLPDNEAFGRANISSASAITSKGDSARYFVNSHILQRGIFKYSDFQPKRESALSKAVLNITKRDSVVFVNDSEIKRPDLRIDNGMAHVIDSVLVRLR